MGMWVAQFDEDGPQNGDVIVRNAKGGLIAIIYSANPRDDAETMRRAQALCKYGCPTHCSTCGVSMEPSDRSETCGKCKKFWEAQTGI